MKQHIRSVLTLVCICAAVALMLAVTNYFTAPIIEQNQNAAANDALLEVMPEGKDFKKVDISAFTLPATVTEAYSEAGGGYVIKLETKGYASGMVIMCGIDANGVVVGSKYLSGNETIGGEVIMNGRVPGATIDTIDDVDTVTSPTAPLTNNAYVSAIKDALNAATILSGGSADLRTEEEILQENLASALPEGEGKFTKLFIVEEIEGIDAIYKAENGSGYVCVIGERFIATNRDGKVIGDADPEEVSCVVSQMAIILGSVTEDIDLSAYEGLPSQLISAKKTASGNYVLEIKGAGYGINGGNEWHPASGEYIVIRVSITADGTIIDCLTVSQAESENFGDACADEKFYGQFDGKTESDYLDVDAISGATKTTDGYLKAIERAFALVKIFEGGAGNE